MLRPELSKLRGGGFIERAETADAPKGMRDIVYSITPLGSQTVVGSREYAEHRARWQKLERRKPGSSGVVSRLELILSLEDPKCRLIEFSAHDPGIGLGLGAIPPVAVAPDFAVTMETFGETVRQTRFFFELDLVPPEAHTVQARFVRCQTYLSWAWQEAQLGIDAARRLIPAFVIITRTLAEEERLVAISTSEGWRWGRSHGLYWLWNGGMLVTSAEGWCEKRLVRVGAASGETSTRPMLLMRSPKEILSDLLWPDFQPRP